MGVEGELQIDNQKLPLPSGEEEEGPFERLRGHILTNTSTVLVCR